ncbi:CRTAC1 family protein [Limnoglobus roseus]|uniref:Tetratricopeptide repeat protein n=1 Tax=Limnoglobus roseus TaxID=2598579 RepID=A0A5C1A8P5_9BACT|nr:CRTAC1 family protein [Limnoglobus roseus]QEL13524.1 tetratricopeptide repeat protein [Limnoglobus roseus]
MLSVVRRNKSVAIAAAVLALVAAGAVVYFVTNRRPPALPGPGDPTYEQYVDAFELGGAALDVEVVDVAEQNLNRAIDLIPQEPAAWVNRALLDLRTGRRPEAERDLTQAEKLAPGNVAVVKLRAFYEENRGRFSEAAEGLRKVVGDEPGDVETAYFYAQLIKREQKPGSDAEYQKVIELILTVRPDNRHLLIERLLAAVRRSDGAAVTDSLARLRAQAPTWTNQGEQTRAAFADLEKAAAGPPGEAVLDAAIPFTNLYRAQPDYAVSADEVSARGYRGRPMRTFLKLAQPRPTPAPPDLDIAFRPEPVADAPVGKWDIVLPVWPNGTGNPIVFLANATEIRRVGSSAVLPSRPLALDGLVPLDWNNDFRVDLLVAGPGGLLFYEQGPDGTFLDTTAKTKLPPEVVTGDYAAVLAADVDLDGDLDILLARRTGPPLLLRNNFDGTFAAQPIFPEARDVRAFAWADLDADGAPDAVVLDAQGKLAAFANERSGQFRPWPTPLPDGRFLAVTVSDANDDGVLTLVALRADGAILRIGDQKKRSGWGVAELGRWEVPPDTAPGSVRLLIGDLDNNGVADLIVSGPTSGAAWLGSGGGAFVRLPAAVPPRVAAAVNFDGRGRIDLFALDADGRPVRFRNAGPKNYHWQTVRFRAAQGEVTGDNRINSFGIGGEIEFRTGTHVVKAPVVGPVVHLGLGERSRCDILRIVWPNGSSQTEFGRPIDQTVVAEQRLKGSCPFLFAWNGERFAFVTDFMWSTPLGMYINAQDQGGFLQTTEWVKVCGDQLVPKDGQYEVRVNANLWETHYFDHLALKVVDHPADTELFADERFMLVPSKPRYHLTGPTRPVARALEHRGADVTEIVRAIDSKYLDHAGRGRYQGITTDHWVEVDLGDDAPRTGPVYLIARGWVHPTDSSVNYAIEQGEHTRPRALSLEVPDGKGGWKVVDGKVGFPAGKHKTVTLRLDGLDGPGVARRVRLRTNMEIYWDAIHYAVGRDEAPRTETELAPAVADLHFRGIVAMSQADPSSPELPDYDRVVQTGQPWRDLIGHHTRFGDVRELVAKVDDRYAILTAGDEITLRFAVPPPPPPGWTRDFLWASDGWVKDGDLNTRFGKTVLPLPAHDMPNYVIPPTRLEDDPVYRRHKKDWDVFHTRYVTPAVYERGLRAFRPREKSP